MLDKIGFTGTREGMTEKQQTSLARYLSSFDRVHFNHGNCVGADEEAAKIAHGLGFITIAHPSIAHPHLQADFRSVEMREPREPLARNKTIVDNSDRLVATPKENSEPVPSRGQGTWFTIRYARKKEKTVVTIWPNGDVVIEIGREV
jgi:hypothetical protein